MKYHIGSILAIPRLLLRIKQKLRKQRKFLHKRVDNVIHAAFVENDGTLTENESRKIYKYYGLAVPAILGEAFSELRGIRLSSKERWVLTCLGSITGLFDDFFDKMKMPNQRIEDLVLHPKTVNPENSSEKLFLYFYNSALDHCTHPEKVKNQLLKVHYAQIASVEQINPNISYERIMEITHQKGGDSVVFYRTALDNIPEKEESDALFQLGATMQLENDIFDIYKDHKDKIYTLPLINSDITSLRKTFDNEMKKFVELAQRINVSEKSKQRFFNLILPVINRVYVCLDQYQNIIEKRNSFNIDTLTRKELICDMEKPYNLIKTAYYQVKNSPR